MDRAAFVLRGHAVRAAFFFTLLGRWRIVTVLAALALFIAMLLREQLTPVLAILVTHGVSQATNSLLKVLYGRPRPYEFVTHHVEPEKSYPSGHAVTAIVFYGGFAVLATRAPFPPLVEIAVQCALVVCIIAIPWSRLALGAHYLSDVVGGTMLGIGWLGAAFALYPWH